jgi:hypothetical protein
MPAKKSLRHLNFCGNTSTSQIGAQPSKFIDQADELANLHSTMKRGKIIFFLAER